MLELGSVAAEDAESNVIVVLPAEGLTLAEGELDAEGETEAEEEREAEGERLADGERLAEGERDGDPDTADASSSITMSQKADADVLPQAIEVPVSPEFIDMPSSPVAGRPYPSSPLSVYAGDDRAVMVAGFVALEMIPITGLLVLTALPNTGVGVPPPAWLSCEAL